MNNLVKRLVAMVVMCAVCLGVTAQFGVTHIAYAVHEAADAPVMMTINDTQVKKGEYASFFSYCKSIYESYYGPSIWADPQAVSMLISDSDTQTTYARVVVEKFHELGLKLDRSAGQEFKKAQAQLIADLEAQGMSFDFYLSMMGMDEAMFRNVYALIYYTDAINDYYFGPDGQMAPTEDEIRAELEEQYIRARHILIKDTDSNGDKLTGDALAAQQAKLKEVQDALAAGEDFGAVMNKYSEDPGLATNPDGYVFTEGEMIDEFYESAKALEAGQTTAEPVQSDFGWHIIRRDPLTQDDYDEYRPHIVAQIAGTDIDQMINEWIEEAEINFPPDHDELTIEQVLGSSEPIAQQDGAASGSAAP